MNTFQVLQVSKIPFECVIIGCQWPSVQGSVDWLISSQHDSWWSLLCVCCLDILSHLNETALMLQIDVWYLIIFNQGFVCVCVSRLSLCVDACVSVRAVSSGCLHLLISLLLRSCSTSLFPNPSVYVCACSYCRIAFPCLKCMSKFWPQR